METPPADPSTAPLHFISDYLDISGLFLPAFVLWGLLLYVPIGLYQAWRRYRGVPLRPLSPHTAWRRAGAMVALALYLMGAGIGTFILTARLHERWAYHRWHAQARQECALYAGRADANVQRFCLPNGAISPEGYCVLGGVESRCAPLTALQGSESITARPRRPGPR